MALWSIKQQPRVMWNHLPDEVLLDIVASTPDFDIDFICNLQLVDRRVCSILKTYERSLCKGYAAKQLLTVFPRFPDLISPPVSDLSFKLVAEVQRRSKVVSSLTHKVFGLAPVCCCHHLWSRWFEAAMLLLYRLQDRCDYDAKVDFIACMPLHALVTIFIALSQSLWAAKKGAKGLIHQDGQPDDPMVRSDLYLVFEDLVLQLGPEFVLDTLNHGTNAEHALRSQHAALEQAQMDNDDGTPPRKSLISQLKRAFAMQADCRIGEVMRKALVLARTKPLLDLDEAGVVKLVRFDEGNEV